MRFLDLFAGIGGFRLGMEKAGHECVGYVEWDKFARLSYEAIHNTEGEWTANDITSVTDGDLEHLRGKGIDVICGGFPCQAFSVAGKRGGFDDTRGTLFFEIARFAKQIKPRLLFLENVKGLLSDDKGNAFGTILHTLDELGYDCEWQVLNSKNFGVPQNRERVFIVGHLRGTGRGEVFPIGGAYETPGINVIGTTQNPQAKGTNCRHWVHNSEGIVGALSATDYKQPKQIIQAVLTPDRLEKGQNGRRFKEDGEPMFTLTAQDKHGVMIRETNDGFHHYRNDEKKSSIQGTHVTYQEGKTHALTRAHIPMTTVLQQGLPIREATKKGFDVVEEGDSVNFQFPDSKTRRGRVGKQIANTLETSNINQGVVERNDSLVGVGHHPFSKKQEFKGYFDEPTPCLIATDYKAPKTVMYEDENSIPRYRIRKLTPRECWRLQGFPEWAIDKAREVNSDSQLYKQAGNSVTVNVVYEIAKRLI